MSTPDPSALANLVADADYLVFNMDGDNPLNYILVNATSGTTLSDTIQNINLTNGSTLLRIIMLKDIDRHNKEWINYTNGECRFNLNGHNFDGFYLQADYYDVHVINDKQATNPATFYGAIATSGYGRGHMYSLTLAVGDEVNATSYDRETGEGDLIWHQGVEFDEAFFDEYIRSYAVTRMEHSTLFEDQRHLSLDPNPGFEFTGDSAAEYMKWLKFTVTKVETDGTYIQGPHYTASR